MLRPTLLALALSATAPLHAALTISVNYSGDPQYAGLFTAAANQWESLLIGYQDGRSINLMIDASVAPIDGPSNVLAQAGPRNLIVVPSTGYAHATTGIMEFDSADIGSLDANGTFGDVILHEMAHVLGFGTLWNFDFNGTTYNDVYDAANFKYTGPAGTAAWQNEFGQTGQPDIEQAGGPGTAGGHWNENDGGFGPTGITDGEGNDLQYELLTGWLNTPNASNDLFISQMTINSFIDIGFIGSSVAAIPEASPALIFSLLTVGGVLRGRGRHRAE